jgi:hypothetical protein
MAARRWILAFLQNAGGDSITSYCVLDSGFWTDEDLCARYEEAARVGVQLHIWHKKEIENYLLVPSAIARYIIARLSSEAEGPDCDAIKSTIQGQADVLWDETFDAMAQTLLSKCRGLGVGGANQRAREILATRCPNPEDRWAIVSGKKLLSAVSGWSQRKFAVSISAQSLARTLGVSEIADEVSNVITAIAHGRSLQPWTGRH